MLFSMSKIAYYLITIGAIMIFVSCASGEEIPDLTRLVSSFDDPRMDCQDLAFFLATHDYSAVPREDYVELNLNGRHYILIPNGKDPGLCDIIPS